MKFLRLASMVAPYGIAGIGAYALKRARRDVLDPQYVNQLGAGKAVAASHALIGAGLASAALRHARGGSRLIGGMLAVPALQHARTALAYRRLLRKKGELGSSIPDYWAQSVVKRDIRK